MKNQYIEGELSKKGGRIGQFADLRTGFVKKWGCFEGVDTLMHTMVQENWERVMEEESCYNNEFLV